MLQIVDAEIGGFRIRDRAQVTGDFQPATVGLVDRRAQLGARDLHVGLERCRAHIGPIRDLTPGVVRILQGVHLQLVLWAVEVRCRGIHRRPWLQAAVNLPLEIEVHHAVGVAPRAHRRHAAGEIQPDEAGAELPVDVGTCRIVQVLVHHHETRHHALARQVDGGGPFGNRDLARLGEGGNRSFLDQERLIRTRGRTGAVDHPRVCQGHHRGIDADEGTHGIAEWRRLRAQENCRGKHTRNGQRESAHHISCAGARMS